jgi:hypothetical protein
MLGTGRNLVAPLHICISLGVDISPLTKTLNFLWERKELISVIRLVEIFNSDNLYSKPRCHVVARAFLISENTIPIDMLLYKFKVMWSISLVHQTFMLWWAWKPHWLALSRPLSSACLWTNFRITFSTSLPVVDKRLIGHKFCGILGSLLGCGNVIYFASFQAFRKWDSRRQWLNKCVRCTSCFLGRCLRHSLEIPSSPQAFLNFNVCMSHDLTFPHRVSSADASRAWTLVSIYCSWFLSHRSWDLNWFSKQSTVVLAFWFRCYVIPKGPSVHPFSWDFTIGKTVLLITFWHGPHRKHCYPLLLWKHACLWSCYSVMPVSAGFSSCLEKICHNMNSHVTHILMENVEGILTVFPVRDHSYLSADWLFGITKKLLCKKSFHYLYEISWVTPRNGYS